MLFYDVIIIPSPPSLAVPRRHETTMKLKMKGLSYHHKFIVQVGDLRIGDEVDHVAMCRCRNNYTGKIGPPTNRARFRRLIPNCALSRTKNWTEIGERTANTLLLGVRVRAYVRDFQKSPLPTQSNTILLLSSLHNKDHHCTNFRNLTLDSW